MAQEVGVRSVQDLKQFGSDLKRLSEQLSNAFHAAEKKMNRVCEGWNDTSNQKFMTEFQKDAKQIDEIANRMVEYAKFIGKRVKSADEINLNGGIAKTYEELVAEYGKLPGGLNALAPIVVPILLMALGSISSMAGWTGFFADLCTFLGKPVIALTFGTIFAIIQLAIAGKLDKFYNITNDTLKVTGPILFVTAAGGVLGKVISTSDMVNYITSNAGVLEKIGIFFPFLSRRHNFRVRHV
jgi:hypothetical protein